MSILPTGKEDSPETALEELHTEINAECFSLCLSLTPPPGKQTWPFACLLALSYTFVDFCEVEPHPRYQEAEDNKIFQ